MCGSREFSFFYLTGTRLLYQIKLKLLPVQSKMVELACIELSNPNTNG
jgi:hypothetical protein